GSVDWRAGWGGIVHALVVTPATMYRMATTTKGGADAGELQGGTQERAFQALAAEIVITAGTIFRLEPGGLMGFALIDEFHRQQAARTHVLAFMTVGLVDHAEAVAFAQVFQKVDLAAHDICHLQRDVVG